MKMKSTMDAANSRLDTKREKITEFEIKIS